MDLQVAFPVKALCALVTLVGLLPGVSHHVDLQVAFTLEDWQEHLRPTSEQRAFPKAITFKLRTEFEMFTLFHTPVQSHTSLPNVSDWFKGNPMISNFR